MEFHTAPHNVSWHNEQPRSAVISGKSKGASIPDAWREAAEAKKLPLGWPEWSEVEPPRLSRKTTSRNELRTNAGERTRVVIPLSKTNGVGLEGVQLRICAWPDRREYDVTATLELNDGQQAVTLARIDAWPPDPHKNLCDRAIRKKLMLPLELDKHHIHRFDDNAALNRDDFARNLPLARPIEERNLSFRRLMDIVCREFHIVGLEEFPSPPNWGSLI